METVTINIRNHPVIFDKIPGTHIGFEFVWPSGDTTELHYGAWNLESNRFDLYAPENI